MKTLLTVLFLTITLLAAQTSSSAEYNLSRSIQVELIPMNYELAIKIIPLVRTYVSPEGHIASVKGTNQLVIADTPVALPTLKNILSAQTVDNFDPKVFSEILTKKLIKRSQSNMLVKQVSVENIVPQTLVAALSALVSSGGYMQMVDNKTIEIKDFADYLEELKRLINQLDRKVQ